MIKLIEEIQKEVIKFTQEIIKIPSFTGQEGELAKVILKKLEEFDLDDAFIDGIGNVVGVIRGQENGATILLNGHLDVVPAGNINNLHPYDPFSAEIDDNTCTCCQTTMTIINNVPFTFYRDRSEEEIRDIYYAKLVDDNWSEPEVLNQCKSVSHFSLWISGRMGIVRRFLPKSYHKRFVSK